jgi:uncharacterized protein YjdB
VTFAPNTTTLTVPITAVGAGSATITASAIGVTSATATVTVTAPPAITVTGATVAVGQTTTLPVTLSVPAPAGGLTVALSGDPTKVTLPPSVFIAAGATTPATPVQITGVAAGTATITATAPGYATGTGVVQVVATGGTSAFSPATLTLNAGSTNNLILTLSAAAPATLTATLASTNTGFATVPSTVTFTAGSTSVAVPVTGVAAGAVTITATTPNFGTATASVTVSAPASPIILQSGLIVAPGQTAQFSVTLATAAGSGGVFITLATSDPSKVTVNPTSIFVPQGSTVPNASRGITVTGVAIGTATIMASSYGYPSAQVDVICGVASGVTLSFSPSTLTMNANATQNLTLTLSSPAPAGGLTVSVNSGNASIATVPASVTFAANATTAIVPVTGIAGGTVTISASTPGATSATATVTVIGSSSINLPASISLGLGNSVNYAVTLGTGAPAGGVTVTLISSDPSKVTVSPSTLFFAAGATTPSTTAQVTGVAYGSATITATAPGLTSATGQVQVGASGTSLLFQEKQLIVTAPGTKNLTLVLSAPAPAGGLTINLRSSAPSIATTPSTVVLPANSTTVNVPVTGVSTGYAVIQAGALPFVPTTATFASVVTSPSIVMPIFQAMGITRMVEVPITLSTPAPTGGLTVSLVSNDTSKFDMNVSSVFIPAGAITPAVQPQVVAGQFVQSEGYGSMQATAPGYTPGFLEVRVYDPITIGMPYPWSVGIGQTSPYPFALPYPAPAGGVTFNLTSSDPTIATITPTAYVPAGANQPWPMPMVNGLNYGTVTIEVSAQSIGYISGVQRMNVQ